MKTIPAISLQTENGAVLAPAQPIPADALRVVMNGANYIIYEAGDTLPPAPPPPVITQSEPSKAELMAQLAELTAKINALP